MTFQESDYPNLKEGMINLIQKYKNPALLVEVWKEIWEIHKRIPIYPGIISTCLPSMVKEKKLGEVKEGERVLIRTSDCEILGTIKSKNKSSICLENSELIRPSRDSEVKSKEIKKILVLEEDVLEKLWPSLVFKDADDRRSKRR